MTKQTTDTTTATQMRETDLAILLSGDPYLGGWGVGTPWRLTPERIAGIRGRIFALADHEHAFIYGDNGSDDRDAEGEESGDPLGFRDDLVPLARLAWWIFGALHSPLMILDDKAERALSRDMRQEGFESDASVLLLGTPNAVPWPITVWTLDGLTLPRQELTHVLLELVHMFEDIAPLTAAVRETVRVVENVLRDVPVEVLNDATSDDLQRLLAEATDDQAAQLVPHFRGPEYALARHLETARAAARQLAERVAPPPQLEDLLVAELVSAELPVSESLREVLPGRSFIDVRDRVAVAEGSALDAEHTAIKLTRALRAGQQAIAREWAVAAYQFLWGALWITGEGAWPTTIDLSTLLADIRSSCTERATAPAGSERTTTPGAASEARAKLDSMVGLAGVKDTVHRVLMSAELAERRREAGVELDAPARHLLFLGNPGTGKTQVARLLAEIYAENGILSKGHLVEVSRSDLVGEGIGETGPKTRKRVMSAHGGVLFIDEAYELASNEGSNDFGGEAVTELVKLMDDFRGEFIVIAAGYREEMLELLRLNPGLESRFGHRVMFDDYTDDQLVEIFGGMTGDARLLLEDDVLGEVRTQLPRKRLPRYGNAREMRRTFEAAIERQGLRLSERLHAASDEEIRTLVATDVREDRRHGEDRRKILDTALDDLDSLIGLDGVKREVRLLIDQARMEEALRAAGVADGGDARHMLFLGNPGTGKTEIARLLARIFHGLGLLSQGHLVEVHASDLVAGYVGQTALKTAAKVESAFGGVLFIDEAYSLASGAGGQHDFGGEAIAKLITFMEDYRDDLVVIAAGYENEMAAFLASNTGLASRFPIRLSFPDYSTAELMDVMRLLATKENRVLDEQTLDAAQGFVDRRRAMDGFGNARDARDLFSEAKRQQISRLAEARHVAEPTREQLRTVLPIDIEQACQKKGTNS